MIPTVIPQCAGIDVGKDFITVCVLVGAAEAEPQVTLRSFDTFNANLEQCRQWLRQLGCTHVVMESTGSYWKPLYSVLEQDFVIVLANPEQVKARKGHKTDWQDCQWLAHLLRHGMIRGSYIPPAPVRQLRDLTRRRKQLVSDAVSERNRIHKVLEEANVKLGSVLSDLFGVSGQQILEALLAGQATVAQMAQLAQRRAKQKVAQIEAALEGHRMSEHHRALIEYSLAHLRFLEQQIADIDQRVLTSIHGAGYERALALLRSVPGLQHINAATVLAEIGPDVHAFPSAKHLSSWTGVAPGNRKSAGKQRSGATTAGNRWLRTCLVEAAWAAAHANNCPLRDKFWSLSARLGRKKALMAVAHAMVGIIYEVLASGRPYAPPPESAAQLRKRRRLIKHHIRCLGRLGIVVRSRAAKAIREGFTPSSGPQQVPPEQTIRVGQPSKHLSLPSRPN